MSIWALCYSHEHLGGTGAVTGLGFLAGAQVTHGHDTGACHHQPGTAAAASSQGDRMSHGIASA